MDVPLVFGLLAFVFYQASNLTGREIYEIYKKHPSCIPGWVFGPVWTGLYLCIFFAGYYAFTSPQDTNYFVAMVALYIVNLFLNKYWTVAFFDNERVGLGLLIALFLVLTAIGECVLMGLSELWVSLGLYLAYGVWLAVALVLNFQWWQGKDEKEDDSVLPVRQQFVIPAPKRFMPPRMPKRGMVKNM